MNARREDSDFPELPLSAQELRRIREETDKAITAYRCVESEYRVKSKYLELAPEARRKVADPWDSHPAIPSSVIAPLMMRFDLVRDYLSVEENEYLDLTLELMRRFHSQFDMAMRQEYVPHSESSDYADGVKRVADAAATVFNILKILERRIVDQLGKNASGHTGNEGRESTGDGKCPVKPKRSTEGGDARIRLIAALTKHHKYADGGCLNLESIGCNELARQAGVAPSTASDFFNKELNRGEKRGHAKYKSICWNNTGRLVDFLKVLNGDFSPHDLYGQRPADEDNREDAE